MSSFKRDWESWSDSERGWFGFVAASMTLALLSLAV
jgi:hypothetical protein